MKRKLTTYVWTVLYFGITEEFLVLTKTSNILDAVRAGKAKAATNKFRCNWGSKRRLKSVEFYGAN